MTDTHYLSDDMKQFLKEKLEALHQEVLAREQEALETIKEDQAKEADPLDLGTMESLQYTNEMYRRTEHALRLEIEAAINRLDEGIYGYCQETGEPIGIERLMAVPYTRYCLEVQKNKEIMK